jgi:universal stress protein E
MLMNRLTSILVGIDFTQCSAGALRQALRIAQWNQATLHAAHVIETEVLSDLVTALRRNEKDMHESVLRGAQGQWQEFIAAIPEARDVSLLGVVDHPVSGLLRALSDHKAELLVLGVRGRTHRDCGSGTVAVACVRKARAMVMLVTDNGGQPHTSVLACIDFSDTSRKALEQAIRVALQEGAKLHVLHVFDGPWNHLHYRSETREASPAFQQQYTDALEQQLRMFCQPFDQELKHLSPGYHLMDYPSQGGGVVKFALENSVDLVVLGTLGRSNWRDLIMGSTAERVVRDTPCSILTVKPD